MARANASPPTAALVVALLLCAGCTSSGSEDPTGSESAAGTSSADRAAITVDRPDQTVESTVTASGFEASACGDGFRSMTLDHTVELRQSETAFDANGAGVALGDLDEDGRVDIVLGNLDGPLRVFWNEGDLDFTEQVLASGRARSVQLVDVDGDGDLDVVTGPGFGPPLIFTNLLEDAPRTYRITSLPGVTASTYSMIWFDPDRDGDLDAVLAAYDMEFGAVVGGEYVSDGDNGVWFVEQADGGWQAVQLAAVSHALAVTALDLDADADADLLVGNDFGVPDGVWLWDDGWVESPDLLATTAANTMSFDVGDVDSDGDDDLYATDMAPFDDSNAEFWAGMAEMEHDPPGPQLVENVLVDIGDEELANRARIAGVDATGWSWSGRLVDLDQDRDLDLYVANGMLPSPLFPFDEPVGLVEPNLAYRNDGGGGFERADDWGLSSTSSSRGIAAADLDGDGDLDLVASTVDAPAEVFVNELCEGSSLIVELRTAGNTRALGADVIVASSSGTQRRTIRSGVGYLSADPAAAHFGLGEDDVEWVAIYWPDGETTVIDGPDAGSHLLVERP